MPKGFRYLTKLNHVKATLPSLILRYEALMATQAGGELNLRNAGSLTSCDKELNEFLMPRRED